MLPKVGAFDPSVIVLDLRFPRGDGVDVLREPHARWPWVKVIIATGHGDEQDAIACLNDGAFAYLKKIVLADDLLEKCEQARQAVPQLLLAFHKWYAAMPDPQRVIFQSASHGPITGKQLMDEITRQSEVGREFLDLVAGMAAEARREKAVNPLHLLVFATRYDPVTERSFAVARQLLADAAARALAALRSLRSRRPAWNFWPR